MLAIMTGTGVWYVKSRSPLKNQPNNPTQALVTKSLEDGLKTTTEPEEDNKDSDTAKADGQNQALKAENQSSNQPNLQRAWL